MAWAIEDLENQLLIGSTRERTNCRLATRWLIEEIESSQLARRRPPTRPRSSDGSDHHHEDDHPQRVHESVLVLETVLEFVDGLWVVVLVVVSLVGPQMVAVSVGASRAVC